MPKISLTAARINAGFNQRDAADKLGITIQTLSNYENYRRGIRVDLAMKMCNLYGLTIDDVYFSPNESDLIGQEEKVTP